MKGLPQDRVVLEILETVQLTRCVLARCQQLREIGYALALDDVDLMGARVGQIRQDRHSHAASSLPKWADRLSTIRQRRVRRSLYLPINFLNECLLVAFGYSEADRRLLYRGIRQGQFCLLHFTFFLRLVLHCQVASRRARASLRGRHLAAS